ncbi:hypothetical protein MCEKH37_00316 [Methylophilaceae bacterium]|jgi:hypothetical protein
MKIFFKSVGVLLIIIAMFYGVFTQKHYAWIYGLILFLTIILSIYYGVIENVRAAFWTCLSFLGMLWSGKEMILSVDFDKPFFTSFYWSTLGYLILTVLFMLLTISLFNQASEDYSFYKD